MDWVDDTESSLNPAPIDISSINLGPAIQKARRLNFFFCIVCLLSLLMAGVCLSVSCCIAAFTPQPKNKVTYIGLWNPNPAPLTPEEQAALDRLDRENAKVDAMRGCGVSCSLAMLGFVVLGLSYPLFHVRLCANRQGRYHYRGAGYAIATPALLFVRTGFGLSLRWLITLLLI